MLETSNSESDSDHGQPPPHPSLLMMNGIWNFLNPQLQDWQTLLCWYLLYLSVGQGMRALMKRPHGLLFQLRHASELVVDFPFCIPSQVWPSVKSLTFDFWISGVLDVFWGSHFFYVQTHSDSIYCRVMSTSASSTTSRLLSSCLSGSFPFPDSPTPPMPPQHILYFLWPSGFPISDHQEMFPPCENSMPSDKAFVWSTKFWRFSSRIQITPKSWPNPPLCPSSLPPNAPINELSPTELSLLGPLWHFMDSHSVTVRL